MVNLKNLIVNAIEYLGDAPHRRLVAVVVSMVATKLIGHALNADDVANGIDLLVGGLGGAWSSRTPAVEAPTSNG